MRARPGAITVLCLAAATIVIGPLASARAGTGVSFGAALDGRPVQGIDSNTPLVMRPEAELKVSVAIRNESPAPIEVRAVKIAGQVLGMSFYTYSTRIDRVVPAGGTERATFAVDVSELGEQATGLVPSRIQLLGRRGGVLAEQSYPVDVRGSITSTYGLFGLAVAAITVVLLFSALVRLATETLPGHRWARAMRFAVPGLGLGLTATCTLSAVRVLLPAAGAWLPLVLGGGLLGLLAGFFTPSPGSDRLEPRDDPTTEAVDVTESDVETYANG